MEHPRQTWSGAPGNVSVVPGMGANPCCEEKRIGEETGGLAVNRLPSFGLVVNKFDL